MKTNYYLLEIEGGVEPTVHGPYRTKHERNDAAKQIRRRQKEDDGLFWAGIIREVVRYSSTSLIVSEKTALGDII